MLKRVFFLCAIVAAGFSVGIIQPNAAQAKSIKLTVKANSKTLLGNIFIYNKATCYAVALPIIVEKSAKHGQVTAVKSTFRPNSGPCKGNIIKGYKIYYKTKSGFRGVDTGILKYKFSPRSDNRYKSITWRGTVTVK